MHGTLWGTMPELKKLPAAFYQSAMGNEPVREWLVELSTDDRRAVGHDIATAEFGWPVGMPICRKLGNQLWEIRSSISGKCIARVMFTVEDGRMVLLHAFIKKSQKTPSSDLELAITRMKEIKQ